MDGQVRLGPRLGSTGSEARCVMFVALCFDPNQRQGREVGKTQSFSTAYRLMIKSAVGPTETGTSCLLLPNGPHLNTPISGTSYQRRADLGDRVLHDSRRRPVEPCGQCNHSGMLSNIKSDAVPVTSPLMSYVRGLSATAQVPEGSLETAPVRGNSRRES